MHDDDAFNNTFTHWASSYSPRSSSNLPPVLPSKVMEKNKAVQGAMLIKQTKDVIVLLLPNKPWQPLRLVMIFILCHWTITLMYSMCTIGSVKYMTT